MKPSAKITAHSQLLALLAATHTEAALTAPPRAYVAVLSQTGNPKTASLQFHYPRTTTEYYDSDQVIQKLVQQLLPDLKAQDVELTESTLDYFVQEYITAEKTSALVAGSTIRYRNKPASRSKNQTPWEYLPENVTLQLFAGVIPVIDNDSATLTKNLVIAEQALRENIRREEELIKATVTRINNLSASLRQILPEPPDSFRLAETYDAFELVINNLPGSEADLPAFRLILKKLREGDYLAAFKISRRLKTALQKQIPPSIETIFKEMLPTLQL